MDNVDIVSEEGVLVRSVYNGGDPFTTKVNGKKVYGVHVNLRNMAVTGDIIHDDRERDMTVNLRSTCLTGAIRNANLTMDVGSRWAASGDSYVVLASDVDLSQLDAPAGVTITAKGAVPGEHQLPSGGKIIIK